MLSEPEVELRLVDQVQMTEAWGPGSEASPARTGPEVSLSSACWQCSHVSMWPMRSASSYGSSCSFKRR